MFHAIHRDSIDGVQAFAEFIRAFAIGYLTQRLGSNGWMS
jgi:hypothetical protein